MRDKRKNMHGADTALNYAHSKEGYGSAECIQFRVNRINLLLFPSLTHSLPCVDAFGNTLQASDGASAFPAAPEILLLSGVRPCCGLKLAVRSVIHKERFVRRHPLESGWVLGQTYPNPLK
jgi:hypothetical protein